ncbi:catalase-related domain-containing protein [Nitrospirillum iridis]|uniref:Catalase n=1 Tax=Nitrospirillum iridis TaxID=765888 RepID=A0A7X0AXD3_9PROT|nr:catalase-related domain-containing protein [Nitrospirillum iridis]MBB6251869.1 catalase [Nitrospirillum iridis]
MARYPALFCLTCGRVESVPGRMPLPPLPAAANTPAAAIPQSDEGARIMANMNALFGLLSPAQRAILMDDVAASMRGLPPALQQRQLAHFGRTDPAYGAGLAARLGLNAPALAEASNQAG